MRAKKKTNAERSLVLLGNIEKAQTEAGIDNDLLSVRLGMSERTLQRRKKSPETFTVDELMNIAAATKRNFIALVGDVE